MKFKGTHEPGEATSIGATRRSTVTDHEYSYIEVWKSPQTYGTYRDSYIVEGSTNIYDSSS